MNIFGETLSDYLSRNGITQRDFASKVGISAGSMSQILSSGEGGFLPKESRAKEIIAKIGDDATRAALGRAYILTVWDKLGLSDNPLSGTLDRPEHLSQFENFRPSLQRLLISLGIGAMADPLVEQILIDQERYVGKEQGRSDYTHNHHDRLVAEDDIAGTPPPKLPHAEETALQPGTRLPTNSDTMGDGKGESA